MSEAAMAPPRAEATWDWVRNGALAGIGAVILWIIAFFIIGDVTNKDDATKILAAYHDHDVRILAGGLIFVIGVGLFFFFLGALRSRLLAAEGGNGPVTTVAYAGGVAVATILAIFPSVDGAGAIDEKHLDPSAASAIHKLGDAFFVAAEYLLPVLLIGTAIVVLRTKVFPAWVAWLSLLIAVVLWIGPIGWAALIFAFPIWVLIISTHLLRGARAV
jgi:hypothetical protein